MAVHDSKLTVDRTIDASAKALFDILIQPSRHAEIDGSGLLRSDDHTARITEVGQTFRMNMDGPHMGGEYQTDNTVTGFVRDKLVSWKTAPAGSEPPGWEWVWELTPTGPDSTAVTLTYDWSKVTDKNVLDRVHFPLVKAEQLEHSLANLAEAVSGS